MTAAALDRATERTRRVELTREASVAALNGETKKADAWSKWFRDKMEQNGSADPAEILPDAFALFLSCQWDMLKSCEFNGSVGCLRRVVIRHSKIAEIGSPARPMPANARPERAPRRLGRVGPMTARHAFAFAVLATVSCLLPATLAQTDPSRPINIVVPDASNDFLARLLAQRIGRADGPTTVIEKRAEAAAVISIAQAGQPLTGTSSTGKIKWEIRGATIWLWPDDQKEKATQLGGPRDTQPLAIEFSPNDGWIVLLRHLSSGNFFSFYRKSTDGGYIEDSAGGDEEPVAGFFKVEKTVTKDQIDRWSANFENWDTGFGPAAFVFSWSARLSKGPDNYFMQYTGWKGVYDLEKHAVVRTLSRGKVLTQTQLSEQELNTDYRELRNLLDTAAKESLRLEQVDWLKKRDALKIRQEKVEFTMARVSELEERIAKLKK
jgi:hypothetical protein